MGQEEAPCHYHWILVLFPRILRGHFHNDEVSQGPLNFRQVFSG